MNEKVEESQGKDTVEIHSVKYKEKKGGKEETEGEEDCGRNEGERKAVKRFDWELGNGNEDRQTNSKDREKERGSRSESINEEKDGEKRCENEDGKTKEYRRTGRGRREVDE